MKQTLLAVLTLCVALASAQEVEVVSFQYPPLQGASAVSRDGIHPEIVAEAFAASGIRTKLTLIPTGRAIAAVKSGACLVMIGLIDYFDDESRKQLTALPLMVIDFDVFYTTDRFPQGFRYAGIDDLRPYSVGVMLNGTTDLYGRKMGLNLEPGPNLESVFEKLAHGRSDVCISNDLAGFYLISKLFPNDTGRFRCCRDVPYLTQTSIAVFNKNRPEYAGMEAKFRAGLRTIMQNGTWEKIVRKYYPDGKIPESARQMVRNFLATGK